MLNSKGEEVAVVARPVEVGDTELIFDFVTEVEEADLVGTWTVNGEAYDFDAIAAVSEVVKEANATTFNALKFWAALESEYFINQNQDNLSAYATAIKNATDVATVADVQTIINEVNKNEATADDVAAAVKAVNEATNQISLNEALSNSVFEGYNADWLGYYAANNDITAGDVTVGAPRSKTVDDIQKGIYDVNEARIDVAKNAALNDGATTLDSATLQEAVTLTQKWFKPDAEGTTTKAGRLEALDIHGAVIAVTEANTNAKLSAALNTLVAKVDNTSTIDAKDIHADLMSDYRIALADTARDSKNAAGEIKTVITTENAKFSKFVVEDATVEASATATPKFVIKALRKDGDAFTVNSATTAITVAIGNSGDKAYKITTSKDFVDAPQSELEIEVDATNFNLPTIGAVVEPVIKFTNSFSGSAETYEVKGKLEVTAGVAAQTETQATMELDKADGKYVSGEDVAITFTLKDANDNTLTTENGTYAATITLDGKATYKNITFVNGKATVTVPAREATSGAKDVVVKVTPKVASGELTLTKAGSITIDAAAFSNLKIDTPATTGFKITATDGVNAITDFGTKLVNIQVVEVDGETETPVDTTAVTDYAGNVSAAFVSGEYSVSSVGLLTSGKTYKVTVTVDGVTTTKTITVA